MQVTFPRIDIFSLLILAGAVQGLFLSAIYLSKDKRHYKSNLYIGFLLLSLTFCIFEIFLNYSGLIFKMLWLDNFSEPFIFLIGPLLFLYVSALLKVNQKFSWVHFVWFGFYSAYHILYLIQPLDFKFNSVNEVYAYHLSVKDVQIAVNPDPLYLRRYVNEILGLHWLAYLSLSTFYILKTYKKVGLKIYSMAAFEHKWVRNIHFHIWVTFIIFVIVKIKFGRDLGDYIVASYMAAIMYITTFYIIKNSIVFKPENVVVPNNSNTAKYQKSSLKDVDKEVIISKLALLMTDEKVFKNNLLSLNELSKKAGVAPHHLSQVINEATGKTFFEYMATFRVEEAQKMLSFESNNLTIEEIAEEVGYNSKSAFNKIFKKHTGYTPSEYRENTKNNSARS